MGFKRLVCKVCGHEFRPYASGRVVIKAPDGRHYDTFDCAICGCQVVAQERLVEVDEASPYVDTNDTKVFKEIVFDRTKGGLIWSILDLVYDKKEEAINITLMLKDMLERYSCVTVADYYELTNTKDSIPYSAHKFGWEDLSEMSIVVSKHGYVLHMPVAKRLDVKEQKNEQTRNKW